MTQKVEFRQHLCLQPRWIYDYLVYSIKTYYNNVRSVEGRGQGWLVETRVIYCQNTKLNSLHTILYY